MSSPCHLSTSTGEGGRGEPSTNGERIHEWKRAKAKSFAGIAPTFCAAPCKGHVGGGSPAWTTPLGQESHPDARAWHSGRRRLESFSASMRVRLAMGRAAGIKSPRYSYEALRAGAPRTKSFAGIAPTLHVVVGGSSAWTMPVKIESIRETRRLRGDESLIQMALALCSREEIFAGEILESPPAIGWTGQCQSGILAQSNLFPC